MISSIELPTVSRGFRRSCYDEETAPAIRAALKTERALPERGADPQALLREAAELLFDHST